MRKKYRHFDPAAMTETLFNSDAAVRGILMVYEEWQRGIGAELDAALAKQDPAQLARVTHSIRGTLAQLYAEKATTLAMALELRCKDSAHPFTPSATDLTDLRTELDAVANEVASYLATG
jgi:HPt (histidine-containing phosphotransfer) domain-containing protein